VEHHAGDIGGFAERGIADHVNVGETGDSERVAEAGTARAFDIAQDFQVLRDAEAEIGSFDAGGGMVLIAAEGVGSGIGRAKRCVLRADEIALEGEPIAIVLPIGFGCGAVLSAEQGGREKEKKREAQKFYGERRGGRESIGGRNIH
jgi:hypothetical protein